MKSNEYKRVRWKIGGKYMRIAVCDDEKEIIEEVAGYLHELQKETDCAAVLLFDAG